MNWMLPSARRRASSSACASRASARRLARASAAAALAASLASSTAMNLGAARCSLEVGEVERGRSLRARPPPSPCRRLWAWQSKKSLWPPPSPPPSSSRRRPPPLLLRLSLLLLLVVDGLLVLVGGLLPGGLVRGGLLLARLDRSDRLRALLKLDLALADQQPPERDGRLRRARGLASLGRGLGRELGQGGVEVEAERGVDLAEGDVAQGLVEDEVDEAAQGLGGVDPDGEDLVADGLVLVGGDLWKKERERERGLFMLICRWEKRKKMVRERLETKNEKKTPPLRPLSSSFSSKKKGQLLLHVPCSADS